ncbi:transcriptional regulator (plasmid) [Leptolyngbya boryana NIES-2135]|jgi:MerR family copper efflux transcriptional regulator|uniref:Transcriptional regulator n=1 Tax=Leptolyngbya boryana NIES-2135 TaxID=1973484 RepID=A0A1Z4JRU6_LEPBY|nr:MULTISPECIES: MerR family transcriptional regulator [Leptolyngbya]BAY59430.1 transcriptional regulator [Leptolyngbya boryana NIES-2135]MBD2373015.1 MerR family transcriptional regulator [Leptolyngbya sp. FACHB-238]MBD2397232.1 MerR family transcriptional regulator [Leptolyngbya sp. FACHB-239]MBD2403962.1 MerR family transcriptional regulator [Leptolyngbya sp. FACHB-402]ULP33260.1 MerR family transcriptional regulator [Leptolyngbya boryana IU 594]
MLSRKSKFLRIGQVAIQSGVPIKTLRYYDELGLLKPPIRSRGGFRLFSPEVFDRLMLIKGAQILGLNLQEIKELLQICEQCKCPSETDKQKLETLLQEIDYRILQLRFLQAEFATAIAAFNHS